MEQEIEINGIKMMVDLRHAKVVNQFRVGDAVKLLIKKDKEQEVKSGVIAGFEQFESLPTIVVAYINNDYYGASLKFAYINKDTASKYNLIPTELDLLHHDKSYVTQKMQDEITKKEIELADAKRKYEFFIQNFGALTDEM